MDLTNLLNGCLSIDNQVRKQAEDALKILSQQPNIIPELLQRVQGAEDVRMRHLAAVLLRKRISRHWESLPAEAQFSCKQLLLQRLVNEPEQSVRRAVADVTAIVAKHTVAFNQWNELLGFLHQCSQSPSAAHREVALTLFGSITEVIGEFLRPHAKGLVSVVHSGLGDADSSVRRAALKAVQPLMDLVEGEEEVALFQGLVGAMLQVMGGSLAADDEDTVVLAVSLLLDMVEHPAPLLAPALPSVLQFTLQIAANRELEGSTREIAFQMIHWVARFKPKQLARQKALLKTILDMLCGIACEPEPSDLEEDETPACKLAAQALDALALNIPSQHVFPTVLAFATAAASSGAANERLAAMRCLSVSAEGCADPMRRKLRSILPHVLRCLQDPTREVRREAALAIAQFSENLQPEIVGCYSDVLPALFVVLHDPDAQEHACVALDEFCQTMDTAIVPYLPQLVTKLIEVLQNGTPGAQESAMSALSSAAAAAGREFEPYAAPLLQLLHHCMQQTAAEMIPTRCRATECFGLLVESVNTPALLAAVPGFVELALKGFELDSSELREYSHEMLLRLARTLKADFAPYLPYAVQLALNSCALDDGAFDGHSDEDDKSADLSEGDSEGSSERSMQVHTGVTHEKSCAAQALGEYCRAAGPAYLPYLEPTIQALDKMAEYWHEEVRMHAYESLSNALVGVHAMYPPQAPGTPSPQFIHLADKVVPLLLATVEDEVEKSCTTSALVALVAAAKEVGSSLDSAHLEALSKAAVTILKGEAQCQQFASDDEDVGYDEEVEDDGSHDEDLLAAAGEIVPTLAELLGAERYAPIFASQHVEPLMARLKGSQPPGVRAVASGAFAEAAVFLKEHMAPYVGTLATHLLRELRCEDSIGRQNAAYAVGVLCQHCTAAMAPHYFTLLQALQPLFSADEEDGPRDNAAGAVARLLSVAAPSLPLDAILPVLIGALPLKEDMAEAAIVYGTLAALMTGDQAQRVGGFVPQILGAFGAAMVRKPAPGQEATAAIGRAVAQLQAQYAAQLQAVVGALPEDQRVALAAAATAAASAPVG